MTSPAYSPEFIAARVGGGYFLEPLRLLAAGVAGVNEIDQIMRSLGGFSFGPFERMDALGLEAVYATLQRTWEQLGRPPRLQPHPLAGDLCQRGHLGRDAGRGFYLYDGEPPLPAVPLERQSFDLPPGLYKAIRRFADAATRTAGSLTEQYVFARTLAAIINEGALLVDESAATEPDIDVAMVSIAGCPQGPLAWANEIGRFTCAALLRRLNEQVGADRFRPAAWFGS
ncbi:MAG: hypothetical protein KKB50_14555 [Planctomycetes bacterium]|nr:hypothetical protein [Planctomycetota bacterium]